MADKTIGSLPQAQTVDDASLFVCEQQGVAMKTTGAQWKGFAVNAVSQYVEPAQQAAQQAQQAAQQATQAVSQIGTAVEDTQANAQAAQEAQEAAETAQGLAETAKTEAEAAASGVAGDAQAAEQAKEAAIAAQQAAETAGGNAETSATGAATSASQASQSASDASGSATAAAGSATTASQAANNAQSAQTLAETAKAGAEAARDAIVNMLVEAITLETGQAATVTKSLVDQVYKLTFGLPKGDTGDTGAPGPQGVSVESIQLTSGNHAPGTTDTYTITLSDDSTFQFTVYNGANGTGAGDFMADGSVPMTGPLDMNGNRVTGVGTPTADTDAANKVYVDEALEGMTITTDATPTEDSTNPVQSGGVYTALSKKQDTLTGTEDQLVGFNAAGEAVAVAAPDPLPTGGEVGQVLTKTSDGTAWDDVPSDLPSGGTDGQILTKTDDGVAWENPPDTGVTTFNGRKGEVLPGADDYSASMIKFNDGQTFQQKYDAGQLTGPAGKDGTIGPAGPSGNDATINGVNALTLQVAGQLKASQVGSTYTIDGAFVPVITLTSSDGKNFYGEIPGLEGQTVPPFVGVPNMTATESVARVYINNNNIGHVARITLYADGTSGTLANGPEMLVKDKPVFLQTSPEYSGRLIASGFSQRTTDDNSPTQGSKKFLSSGAVYTALQGKVSTVSSATAGNVATFAEGGQLQDSGLSPEDFGKQDFVVTFSGNAPGPYSCDKTYAEISDAYLAGKRVFAKYTLAQNLIINLNLRIFISGDSGKAVFNGSFFGYNIGLVEFAVSAANEATGSIMLSHEHKPSEITDLAGTDYTTIRVRGIALSTSTPGTISNGCLVGVYE